MAKIVKVFILLEENEETDWLSTVSVNPAFDFLNDEQEDIYTVNDGKPFNDKA